MAGRFTMALCGALMALALPRAGAAEDAAGDWRGVVATPLGERRVAVEVRAKPGGGYEGKIRDLEAGGPGAPLADVSRNGESLSFSVPAIRAAFKGTWDPAKASWVGQWSQSGSAMPLTLEKGRHPAGPTVAGLDGTWSGSVEAANGVTLLLRLRIRTGPYGTVALLDSPDQLVNGLPVSGLARDGAKVAFEQRAVQGRWAGELSADGASLVGGWTQGGRTTPVTFAKDAAANTGPRRSQAPTKPYPYREEEVAFESVPGKVRLAGTLTLPAGDGPFPAAVLISGSGPQDRDETLMGHKPFLILADHLTRQGIAVLRYDDPGFGKSTGEFAGARIEDFAADAAAAVAFLRTRKDIDAARTGLIGHSEGGVVAPILAGQDPDIAFVVLIAAPGVPATELLAAQQRALAPHMGASEAQIEQAVKVQAEVFAAIAQARSPAEAEETAREVLTASPAARGMGPQAVDAVAKRYAAVSYLLGYDPGPVLAKVKAPVLAVNGTKDLQVPAEQNLPGLRERLKHNPDATIVELPGLNHMRQTAETGAVGEYARIEETVAPAALTTISDWLLKRVGPQRQAGANRSRWSR
ncbi:alpha/beta hydrolase [Phenylobacterium sp.]|uniref:alpha/beta hydrolase family protein n=1 Tax=Phenylobacterium sp. TaxID=1871053 RepID=UPI002E3541E4|nr:alpha/beta hydrolase [Phenylobacterium sp.]HEX2559143.1 alpha/beta hydrolase [Phenylobacterium sp.]